MFSFFPPSSSSSNIFFLYSSFLFLLRPLIPSHASCSPRIHASSSPPSLPSLPRFYHSLFLDSFLFLVNLPSSPSPSFLFYISLSSLSGPTFLTRFYFFPTSSFLPFPYSTFLYSCSLCFPSTLTFSPNEGSKVTLGIRFLVLLIVTCT